MGDQTGAGVGGEGERGPTSIQIVGGRMMEGISYESILRGDTNLDTRESGLPGRVGAVGGRREEGDGRDKGKEGGEVNSIYFQGSESETKWLKDAFTGCLKEDFS